MYRALDRVTLEATVHLLVAGVSLIAASIAGVDGSALLVGACLAAAIGLFAVRQRVPPMGTVLGHDVQRTLEDLWIAPALAATTTALALGATPGELQALGGILGLVAMLNYFLQPVYYGVYAYLAGNDDAARAENI